MTANITGNAVAEREDDNIFPAVIMFFQEITERFGRMENM